MSSKPSLIDNFKALPSGTRNGIILGVIVLAMFVYGTMTGPDLNEVATKKEQKDTFSVVNPGSTQATEGIASSLANAEKKLNAQAQEIELLKQQNQQMIDGSSTDGKWGELATLTAELQQLKQRVYAGGNSEKPSAPRIAQSESPAQTQAIPGSLNLPLPPPGEVSDGKGSAGTHGSPPGSPSGPNSTPHEIQVVGNDAPPANAAPKKTRQEIVANIPAGSSFEGVLLNGMDASTSISANKNPTPAVLRIKSEAILPSLYRYDLRDCFVLVGGVGNMSSERVEMRTENMSCINDKGEVYEGKIEAYVVGEDGKVGARARMVSKQGALLAKSFMAGFVGGVGSAFSPQPIQSINLNGASQEYQYPSADAIIGSGVGKGMNQAGSQLARFYLALAEQMFPILEMDAGRKMTIVLLKGTDLVMEKKAK